MTGVEPMAVELCRLADRLASLRAGIASAPHDMKLINGEMKVTAAFARAWKTVGLADSEAKGKSGWPLGVPRGRKAG
jgi:hypothetical protein